MNPIVCFLRHSLPHLFAVVLLTMVCALPSTSTAQSAHSTQSTVSYSALIKSGNTLLQSNNSDEALELARKAIQLDDKRYEGYALTALILEKQGHLDEATQQSAKALELAPAEKKVSLAAFRDSLEKQRSKPTGVQTFSPEARRKYDVLMLIIADADKSKSREERQELLKEFISKSATFLNDTPSATNILILRGAAAVELDYPGIGFDVGRKIKDLKMEATSDPAVRRLLAQLERKEWLGVNRAWRDWSKWTIQQIKGAALNGDVEAEVALGRWSQVGDSGISHDIFEARNWYQKAKKGGDDTAAVFLEAIAPHNAQDQIDNFTKFLVFLQGLNGKGEKVKDIKDAKENLKAWEDFSQGIGDEPKASVKNEPNGTWGIYYRQ